MDKIRIGVIGTGHLGRFHAEKYASLEDVELTAVVDIDEARARDVASAVGAIPFSRREDMIGRVDAVSIAVPTSEHFAVAKDCLANGIDVLLEKPITTTPSEAQELIDIAAREGCILQVGHIERYNSAILALKNKIRNPKFIESHRMAPFTERGTDVDVLLDLMIHDIDIILCFTDSPMEVVSAVGVPVVSNRIDIANVRLQFENGCVANLTVSRISMERMRKIRFFLKDAYVSINYAEQSAAVFRREAGSAPGGLPNISMEQVNVPKSDALENEIRSFLRAVKDRTEPEVSGEMAKKVLEVVYEVKDRIREYHTRVGFDVPDMVLPE